MNKLSAIALSAMFLLTAKSIAMNSDLIKMPSEAVLKERLKGYDHFVEKTEIHKELADREMYPFGVANLVTFSIEDYCNMGFPSMLCFAMRMHKPIIIRSILGDNPAAIAELVEAGILQPK